MRAARLISLLSLALATAGPALATQEYILPTLFDVTGVAADDVLNIRATPGGEIIGRLAPDATRIEVVAHDDSGGWAQVNTGERSGWVSLRYLAYRVDVWEEGRLPDTLHCLGTEPFWALSPEPEAGVAFSTPEAPERVLDLTEVLSTGVFRNPRRALVAEDEGLKITASLVPAACRDGMSDRAYGLDATLVLQDGGAARMLTGCCSIAPR